MTDTNPAQTGETPAAPEALEVLLQTSIPSAEALVERLSENGIDAELIDRPTSLAIMLAFGTYRVRIGVPGSQRQSAQALLRAWEPDVRANVRKLAASVHRQFAMALVPGAIAFAIHVWKLGEFRVVTLVSPLLVSFVAFMALAFLERIKADRANR